MKYLKRIFEHRKESERKVIENYFSEMIDDKLCRPSQEGLHFLNSETMNSVIVMFEFGLSGIKWPVEKFYQSGLIPNNKVRTLKLSSINKEDFFNKFDQFLSLCEEFGDSESLDVLRKIRRVLVKLDKEGYDLEFDCDFNSVEKNWIERQFGRSNCYVVVHSKN